MSKKCKSGNFDQINFCELCGSIFVNDHNPIFKQEITNIIKEYCTVRNVSDSQWTPWGDNTLYFEIEITKLSRDTKDIIRSKLELFTTW